MKHPALFFLFCLVCLASFGQRVIDVNQNTNGIGNTFFTAGGEPMVTAKFVGLVEGTPYFKDNWLKGSVVLHNGDTYKNITSKLNLLDKNLLYKDLNGVEMVATQPIKEVVLYDDVQDEIYRFIHHKSIAEDAKTGWYLWYVSGKASLYKYFDKLMTENKPYGSATYEQRIRTKEKFFVLHNQHLVQVNKVADLPALFSDRKSEMESFIKSKIDKSKSTDDQFVAAVEFYNALK